MVSIVRFYLQSATFRTIDPVPPILDYREQSVRISNIGALLKNFATELVVDYIQTFAYNIKKEMEE
ncbi:hypothetical protein [Enterococcus sp. DIV1315a]|uniref:hypothetical protein n=1 Tax=Enterococcus sp. DIV1315a TaxID=2774695 RepID=UPI003F2274EF